MTDSAARIAPAHDKLLFTPGPLTTSQTVKQAMLRDLGSRDALFIDLVRDVRRRLLRIGEVADAGYTAVPMQGSGTFAIESVFASAIPPDGRVLILVNGAYGQRMGAICKALRIDHTLRTWPEHAPVDAAGAEEALTAGEKYTHLAVVHCETTTGIMNPVLKLGALARQHGLRYIVDAMSSFGAVPLNIAAARIDYLVSSANKCIEGVPGFGFVIAREEALEESAGWARSVSLDLYAQWKGLDASGQFRFTPPTHALLAFHQALLELEWEGGVTARGARYAQNHEALVAGMRAMGFTEYIEPSRQGYIITSFRYPDHPNFAFETFYEHLSARGCVIYPGKVSDADCFRIGNIGRLHPGDIGHLLADIRAVMREMAIDLPPPAPHTEET